MWLTIQLTAQQLQSKAQALIGGSFWVDPNKAGQEGTHGPQLRGVVVLITGEYLKETWETDTSWLETLH